MSLTNQSGGALPSGNERRADAAMKAIEVSTECAFRRGGVAGLRTDVEDLLGDVRHLCDRYELDYGVLDRAAGGVYHGDFEDAPRVVRRKLSRAGGAGTSC